MCDTTLQRNKTLFPNFTRHKNMHLLRVYETNHALDTPILVHNNKIFTLTFQGTLLLYNEAKHEWLIYSSFRPCSYFHCTSIQDLLIFFGGLPVDNQVLFTFNLKTHVWCNQYTFDNPDLIKLFRDRVLGIFIHRTFAHSLVFGFGLTFYSHCDLIEISFPNVKNHLGASSGSSSNSSNNFSSSDYLEHSPMSASSPFFQNVFNVPTVSTISSLLPPVAQGSSQPPLPPQSQQLVLQVKQIEYNNACPSSRNGSGYAYRSLEDALFMYGGHIDDSIYAVFDIWKFSFQSKNWTLITTLEPCEQTLSLRSAILMDTYFINCRFNTIIVQDLNYCYSNSIRMQEEEEDDNDDEMMSSSSTTNAHEIMIQFNNNLPIPDEDYQIAAIMAHNHNGKIPSILIMGGYQLQKQVIEILWNAPYSTRIPHKLYQMHHQTKVFTDVCIITVEKKQQ